MASENKEQVQGNKAPAQPTKPQSTSSSKDDDMLLLMQEFIAAIQHVDKTTTEHPQAENALELFTKLVEGV